MSSKHFRNSAESRNPAKDQGDPRARGAGRSFAVSRRRWLGGMAGASLALPLSFARKAEAAAPKRLVIFHVPEGAPVSDEGGEKGTNFWWPNGDLSNFPAASKPMEAYRDKLLFIKGVGVTNVSKDYHIHAMEKLLTGDLGGPTRKAGSLTIPGGMSVDQVVGKHLGAGARYDSYQVGILSQLTRVLSKRRVSYTSSTGGRDAVNDPLKVFDDLLGGIKAPDQPSGDDPVRRRLMVSKSVLDNLLPEVRSLMGSQGADGDKKLDAYLTSIRETETRISAQLNAEPMDTPDLDFDRPTNAGAQSFWANRNKMPEIADIQMLNIRNALAADTTRVAVLQWQQTVNQVTFGFAGVSDPKMTGHNIAHAVALNKGAARERYRQDRVKVFNWFSRQFVKFLDLLDEIPDGEGTLLDSTMVLYISEMGSGHHHARNFPVIVAGSAGGAFRQGRLVNALADQSKLIRNRRTTADLMTTIARGYGVNTSGFGPNDVNKGVIDGVIK